ncbi:uncharacterized protein Dana_GF14730 [Drosophila ananassae]|uniref:Uncharacterized protein n=1 Tax=Drosophila ananassae TaxID=7217 RepID=B3MNA6_DROAN|nr:uncharacterized protein LOC6497550 [Drosophila ananassae]EDV31063.1 uncharacterized protein Dana_GF14730 [Drosophila ananassae]
MKKVLLTKSQKVERIASGGELLPKNPLTPPLPIRVIAMTSSAPVSSNTYNQRKSFKPFFEDIFKSLMCIPDKALQQRVINAINGHNNNSSDKDTISHQGKQCSCGAPKVDASTQTHWESDDGTKISQGQYVPPKSEKNPAIKNESVEPMKNTSPTDSNSNSSHTSTPITSPEVPVKVPKKRGRKRNTCVPQVVKRSAAEMALQEREEKQLTPVVTKKKKLEVTNMAETQSNMFIKTPERRNSSMSDISLSLEDIGRVQGYIDGTSADLIHNVMAQEFVKAKVKSEEGLFPIHDYILRGDVFGVKRQVFVFPHVNADINALLSTDGEDCLQLALTNNVDAEIVSIIISAGCFLDHFYENSNTVIHLAVINNINLESVRVLMKHIDLNLLLEPNDDGYTALHLAVRYNQFHMAEAILDCIDERDLGEPIYRRTAETPNTDGRDEKAFSKYYDRACDNLEQTKSRLKPRRMKLEVINASETRAGNTPLFYAIEGELEHFCYFLLAHLADPDQENFIGHSPKSYHYDYARNLRISLKVSRVMDKVIGLLNS